MNLQEARAEARSVVEGLGMRAFESLPEKAEPPYALILGDDPYLDKPEGGTVRKPYKVHLVVLFLAKKGTNKKVMDDLDSMVTQAIPAFEDAGWTFTGAGAPGQQESNQGPINGIFVEKFISLEEGE